MMDRFDLLSPIVPLTMVRTINGVPISGLTVTATAVNAKTNAVLLSNVVVPEISTGSGIYTYLWTHGLIQDTEVAVTYNYVTGKEFDLIYFTTSSIGRAL